MIKIINATPQTDFDAVRELYYQTWQSAYAKLLPAPFLAHLTRDRWHPETQWQTILLAVTETGQLVGVCRYGAARLPQYDGWGELQSIYVLPAWQHQGVGAQLMQVAKERLAADYDHVYLAVLANNLSAQRFYQQIGFQLTTDIQHQPTPDGELTTVIMTTTR